MAATALSMWPNAVIMMTALSGCLAFSSRTTWMPSMSGNRRSTRATSGDNSSASSRPSLPVPAVWTSTSSWARTRDTSVRMLRSSSMTRMVSIAFCDSSRTDPAKKIANCVEIGQTVGEKWRVLPINYECKQALIPRGICLVVPGYREGAAVISDVSRQSRGLNELLRQLIQIGIALSSERDLGVLLERIVAEARHFTNAEAGTLFPREGGALRFAVVQYEPFVQRFGAADTRARVGAGAERLALDLPALADHVAKTGETIVLPRTYGVPDGRPSAFDAPTDDGTRSVLAVPLQ